MQGEGGECQYGKQTAVVPVMSKQTSQCGLNQLLYFSQTSKVIIIRYVVKYLTLFVSILSYWLKRIVFMDSGELLNGSGVLEFLWEETFERDLLKQLLLDSKLF